MNRLLKFCVAALASVSAPAVAQQAWQLDPAFAGGRVTVPFDLGDGDTDLAIKVLLYPPSMGSKVLLVGQSTATGTAGVRVTLARLLANGALDPSFGAGTGKVAKDACMDQVRDAAFDSQFRIVVVGDTRCSGNASTDVGVLRFTESGADDTSFSGDGGLGFKFKPDFDGRDRGHAVLVLADDSLLVAGGYKFPSVESGYVQRVSSSGVVAATDPGQTFSGSSERRIIAGISAPNNKSLWLIQVDDPLNSPGAIWRIDNSSLQRDTSFEASTGERLLVNSAAAGYSACPGAVSGSHTVTAMVRFGSTIKVFGYASGAPTRSFFAGVDESDGLVRKYGCLDIGTSPVEFQARTAAVSSDSNTVYLGGNCGSPNNFCLWRLARRAGDVRELQPDLSFSAGAPASTSFTAGSGQTPASIAFSLAHADGQTVLAGYRVFNSADLDFAAARFGAFNTGLFSNGFEGN
ncbi:hypothetical protein [Aquimonas sp.]|jgi:hypothetical protein|uniref:hypothetical protein n=1 Tax=Aquimonas sp. TaxID=1872588 RepID=UPI0037C07535